uniref:Beta-defensin n=1 Tax=Xiphophorus maculatus TaxID=8083 RepID=A0A3B5QSK6_XIPMA
MFNLPKLYFQIFFIGKLALPGKDPQCIWAVGTCCSPSGGGCLPSEERQCILSSPRCCRTFIYFNRNTKKIKKS